MVNPRPPFGNEPRDRGFVIFRLEQLHKWLTCSKSNDVRPIRIVEGRFVQAEHIAEEGKRFRKGLYGDSDV